MASFGKPHRPVAAPGSVKSGLLKSLSYRAPFRAVFDTDLCIHHGVLIYPEKGGLPVINELYKLSAAMDEAGIRTQSWHRKYKPIPNIRATAPCVRLVLAEGVITDFFEVSADLGAGLRKYGSNQGSYRIVEHGVYCMPFFVNPNYAQKSGCTAEDIELLKLLIPHAYELNRSAIRPDVRIRHA